LGLRHFFVTDGQKRDYLSRASQRARGATKKSITQQKLYTQFSDITDSDDTNSAFTLGHMSSDMSSNSVNKLH